jgi:hypothetical protein
VIASGISRDKNQYRIFFNNGRALYLTLDRGFMPMLFPDSLTCYCSAEDGDGEEVAFSGDDQGYVYQFDKGNSFDGEQIESYCGLVFNHVKSPRTRKRYRKAVIEIQGVGYSDFWISADLGYGGGDAEHIPLSQIAANLSLGRWDTGVWDVGVWDGRILAPEEFELTGTAENISLRFAQISDYAAPLTFFGAIMQFTPRRLSR